MPKAVFEVEKMNLKRTFESKVARFPSADTGRCVCTTLTILLAKQTRFLTHMLDYDEHVQPSTVGGGSFSMNAAWNGGCQSKLVLESRHLITV